MICNIGDWELLFAFLEFETNIYPFLIQFQTIEFKLVPVPTLWNTNYFTIETFKSLPRWEQSTLAAPTRVRGRTTETRRTRAEVERVPERATDTSRPRSTISRKKFPSLGEIFSTSGEY